MSDIVERLRCIDCAWSAEGELAAEAADEIERLREDLTNAKSMIAHLIDENDPEELERLRAECLRLSYAETDAMAVVLSQEGQIERLRAELAAKQAKIDALMLEYCPNEMTPEQLQTWGKHQRAALGDEP